MSLDNNAFAQHFDELGDWLEIQGENAFRIRAYRNAAETIRAMDSPLSRRIEAGDDLSKTEGIGSAIADKSVELYKTGQIAALEKLREKYPPTLRSLMNVPGLGAKKVGVLFNELGINDLTSLQRAAEAEKIRTLKGFGAKTEQTILHGIHIAQAAMSRMRIDKATALIESISEYLSKCEAIQKFEFAGSFRRHRDTIGDIDVLAVARDANAAMDFFARLEAVSEVILRGPTKLSVRLQDSFQADLRIVPAESWGAALQYFTGSQQHNIRVRQIAKDKGLKLNEYGLFPDDDPDKSLEANNEAAIYKQLGLPMPAPEFRENRFEFSADFAKRSASIITLSDIRGDLHMHTLATDGTETIETMAAAARQRGLAYIAITDHSQRVSMANGMTPKRLLEQWATIDQLNAATDEHFYIFKGIECDILESGGMDLPDDILAQADWVLASVHYGQKQSSEQITERILGAINNPNVTAIAHPTGRLIGRRDPYQVDLEAVFAAAVANDTLLELNANPHRLDLSDINCMAALKAGVTFTINTDAHSIENLDLMHFGIMQARRAGMPADRVANTWPFKKLKAFLK